MILHLQHTPTKNACVLMIVFETVCLCPLNGAQGPTKPPTISFLTSDLHYLCGSRWWHTSACGAPQADTMTVSEAHNHQRRVQQALQQAESSANRVLVHRFRGDDLDAAGILFGGPPFLVMCSETFDASLGRYAPIREYPWGVAEALRHSDLTAVKRLIFEVRRTAWHAQDTIIPIQIEHQL